MLAAVPGWAVDLGLIAGIVTAVAAGLQVLGFPVGKAVRALTWPIRKTWTAVVVDPLAGWFRHQITTVVQPELEAIGKAVNHQPEGAMSIAEQVTEMRAAVMRLPELVDDLVTKHKANEERIEKVEHSLVRHWLSLLDIRTMVRTMGRALGISLPDPPQPTPYRREERDP